MFVEDAGAPVTANFEIGLIVDVRAEQRRLPVHTQRQCEGGAVRQVERVLEGGIEHVLRRVVLDVQVLPIDDEIRLQVKGREIAIRIAW